MAKKGKDTELIFKRFGTLTTILTVVACVVTFCACSQVSSSETVQVRFALDGGLMSLNREVPPGSTPLEAAIKAQVAGLTAEEAGNGLTSALPAGVKLVKLVVSGDTVSIDMSPEVVADLDEAKLEAIFDQFKATIGDFPEITAIRLTCKGRLLSTYLPTSPEVGPSALPLVRPQQVGLTGLSGRNITIGPSHGRFWNGSGWYWQRGFTCGLGEANLEDLLSIRLMQFLYQYLTQDGATVHVPRDLNESDCCNSYEGQAWYRMAAYSWLKHNGLPCSVWASSSGNCGAENAANRSSDDIRARPLFADYRGSDIYLACHTNAGGGGAARGTETYRDTAMEHPAHVANSLTLANSIQNNVISAIRDMYDSGWVSRGVKDSAGGFGEIRIPNRPAILIELAFHDGCVSPSTDAYALVDDYFKSVAEWGLYKGVCAYFGTSPTWDKYSDEYVSDTIPTTMNAGQAYNVSVTFRNRGVLWREARAFRLGAVGESDPFTASTRFTISGDVRPGNTYTFNFTMTAPLTSGDYVSDWRMVRDGVAWFGATLTKNIHVNASDNEPPSTPTGLTATVVNPVKIQLNWTASTDNVGVASYDIRRNGSIIASSPTNSYTDGSCQGSTSYTYEVRAKDAATNVSGWSNSANATTPANNVPPTVPTGLVGNATGPNSVQLNWTASTDDVGPVSYEVRRNGLTVWTSATNSYIDNTASAATTYTYDVRAKDAVPNYSAWSSSVDVTTPIAPVNVFTDGFNGNLNNWTQVSSKEYDYSTTQNHGTYTGAGAAFMAAGQSDQMYHTFTRPFAQATISGWFWDQQAGWKSGICGKAYRQTLSARDNVSGVNMIIDNCLASNVGNGNYYWRTVGSGGVTYTSYATRNPSTDCNAAWIYFETAITPGAPGASPTGTFVAKVTDGAGTTTTTQNLTNDYFSYGLGRITLGLGVSSVGEAYWDDITLNASPPNQPTMGTPVANSASQITWAFGAADNNHFGFDITDNVGTQVSPAYASAGWITRSATSWAEAGLAANTSYTRRVRAWNGTLNSALSAAKTRWTLSVPPTASLVTCDRAAGSWFSTPPFNFTAVGGFGAGKVDHYLYAWDKNPSYTFDGSEPSWNSGTLALSASSDGEWYLHVKGYNGENVPNGTLDLGPYGFDSTAPGAVTVTDQGTWTPSQTTLKASWTAASDGAGSGIAGYDYAIGTSNSTQDVKGWTSLGNVTTMTDSSLTLADGQIYYIQVRAKDNVGLTGTASASDGITVAPPVAVIGDVWPLADTSVGLSLRNKIVTAITAGAFWIEEIDQSAAIKVLSTETVAPGDKVSVAGVLGQSGTQRALMGDVVEIAPGGPFTLPNALGMKQTVLGGKDVNLATKGVTDSIALYSIGLRSRVWGNVTHADTSDVNNKFFYLDDGCNLSDGSGHLGVRVLCGGIDPPTGFAHVTGIIGSEQAGPKVVPVIIVTRAEDIEQ